MRTLCQQWVIQDRETGLFLAEDLSFCRSFAYAGRCFSADEAFDTASDNLEPWAFELHSFFDYVEDR